MEQKAVILYVIVFCFCFNYERLLIMQKNKFF